MIGAADVSAAAIVEARKAEPGIAGQDALLKLVEEEQKALPDPATKLLYVNSNEMAWLLRMEPRSDRSLYQANCASCHRGDLAGTPGQIPSLAQSAAQRSRKPAIALAVKGKAIGAGRRSDRPEPRRPSLRPSRYCGCSLRRGHRAPPSPPSSSRMSCACVCVVRCRST